MVRTSVIGKLEWFSSAFGEKGFTLVEIVIASGLVAVLALLISSLFYSAGRQNSALQNRGQAWDFTQEASFTLKTKPLPTPPSP